MKPVYRFLLILLGAAVIFTACSTGPSNPEGLYQQGLEQLADYRTTAAESSFVHIRDIDSTSQLAILGVGLVKEQHLEWYDALAMYSTFVDAGVPVAPAYERMFRVLEHLNLYQDALEVAQVYREQNPELAEPHLLLGEAYLRMGEYRPARRELDSARVKGFDARSIDLLVARSLWVENMSDSAQVYYDRAVSDEGVSAIAMARAADFVESKGLIDSAMALSRSAFAAAAGSMDLINWHINRAYRTGYREAARQAIVKLDSLGAEDQTLYGLWIGYYQTNDVKAPLDVYVGPFRSAAGKGTLTYWISDMVASGEKQDVISMLQDQVQFQRILDRATYADDFKNLLQYATTRIRVRYDMSPQTLPNMERLTGRRANRLDFRMDYILTQWAVALRDQAAANIEALYETRSRQKEWVKAIGDYYNTIQLKDFRRAAEYYRECLVLDSFYLDGFESLIAALRNAGQYGVALREFDTYDHLIARKRSLGILQALVAAEAGRLDDAVALFESALVYKRLDLSTYRSLVALCDRSERTDLRDKLLALLDQHAAGHADANSMLAGYAVADGRYEAALDYADRALQVEPDHPDANAYRAYALYQTGRTDDALALFAKNTTLRRFFPLSYLYHSKVLANYKDSAEVAANLARTGTSMSWGAPEYIINLSEVYYKLGRCDLSEGEAKKALNWIDNDPRPAFRIGVAMYCQGEDGAAEFLEQALKLGLKGAEKDSALTILGKL